MKSTHRKGTEMSLKFDDRGLISAIIQDDETGEVLTLFYMNDEAVRRTLQSGQVWRYSRQHQALMLKGETSGNYLNVRRVLYDCDEAALRGRRQAQVGPHDRPRDGAGLEGAAQTDHLVGDRRDHR